MASNNLSSGPATAFLRLPTELRFQVYDHLFADSSFWISRKFKELSVPPTPPLPFSTPSDYSINNEGCQHRHQILLACRSIHDEAHALWSTFTIWTLPDQHVLRAFLRPSSGLLPGLKHLHLTSPGISDLSPELQLDWLESLPGLETLTIDVPLTICYWEREQSSAKIYEDTQNSILQLPINPRRQQTDTELHSVVQQVFGLPRRRFALVVAVETFYYVPSLCCRTVRRNSFLAFDPLAYIDFSPQLEKRFSNLLFGPNSYVTSTSTTIVSCSTSAAETRRSRWWAGRTFAPYRGTCWWNRWGGGGGREGQGRWEGWACALVGTQGRSRLVAWICKSWRRRKKRIKRRWGSCGASCCRVLPL